MLFKASSVLFGTLSFICPLLEAHAATAQNVEFLHETPTADGKLSEAELALKTRLFPKQYRFDNPKVEATKIAYRLGFTPTHLYVAITTNADKVTYRNRGYLWGDGWRLLLGDTADGSRTPTYIDVLVSPRAPGDDQLEIVIGTQDHVQVLRRLSESSQAAEGTTDEGTVFEAVIAWTDLAPFHPGFDPRIGMNLYFAKGHSTPEAGDFPYGYALVHDEGIWDEEIVTRAIVPFEFDVGKAAPGRAIVHYRLGSRHVIAGQPIRVETASLSPSNNMDSGDVSIRQAALPDAPLIPLTPLRTHIRNSFTLPSGSLAIGEHEITLPDGSRHTLWVLPDFAPQAAREAISGGKFALLSPGTRESLSLLLERYEQARAALRPYADASAVMEEAEHLDRIFAKAAAGADPFEGNTGPYRRGFRSAFDGSLQPYSVKLPKSFSQGATYPALLFLHGSGSDERGLLDQPRSNGRMIEVAPYGRDKFYAYASQASQNDIVEALDAAVRDFPIDRKRVVIGGFSMGGYGALRSFYEHPERYVGVAVFAGHPNLANEWLGDGGHPNFLDPKFLSLFKGVPVFIYHGQKDAALSYDLALKLAEALRKAGADVTFSGPADIGHTYQDPVTHAMFVKWLEQF